MTQKSRGGEIVSETATIDSNLGNTWTWNWTRVSDSESIAYQDIANYHQRKRRGDLLPVNSCFHTKITSSGWTPGTANWTANGSPDEIWSGSLTNDPNHVYRVPQGIYHSFSSLDPSDYHYLVSTALANAKADAWDVLTFIAELRDTLALLSEAAPRISRLVMDIANKSRKSKNRLDAAQNLWLEARYGWRPLIGDISDAMAAYQRLSETFRRSRGYSTALVNDSASDTLSFIPGADSVCPTYDIESTRTVKFHGFACIDMYPSHQALGFDPVLTAWELVPYSFVLDWLSNIGDTLAALSPTLRLKGQVTGFSISETQQSVAWCTGATWGVNKKDVSITLPTSFHTVETYSRYSLAAPYLPSIRLNFDPLKAIDGIFLLRGLKDRSLQRILN